MQTKSFLGALDHERIVKAIQEAEARSRGEVRVHVSQKAVADAQPDTPAVAAVEAAAARQFEALGMTQTAERNGVLLFVAPVSQTFAVVGDEGQTYVGRQAIAAQQGDPIAHPETRQRCARSAQGLLAKVDRDGSLTDTAQHGMRR